MWCDLWHISTVFGGETNTEQNRQSWQRASLNKQKKKRMKSNKKIDTFRRENLTNTHTHKTFIVLPKIYTWINFVFFLFRGIECVHFLARIINAIHVFGIQLSAINSCLNMMLMVMINGISFKWKRINFSFIDQTKKYIYISNPSELKKI